MTNARDLSNRLAELLRRERTAMADFVLALADFDRQKAWRALGHASLFAFLRGELGLSAGAAQYRKTAAELVQRHAEVEAALRSGELCLSSIIELAKVLTPDNVGAVLPRFFGLSRREAANVAVSIRPVEKAPSREVVTVARAAPVVRVPNSSAPARAEEPGLFAAATSASEVLPAEAGALESRPASASGPVELGAAPAATVKPSSVEPLDSEHVRLHLTVSRRLLAKLQAARDALSHARPGATSEEVLEAALDVLLKQHASRKGLVAKPRNGVRQVASGAIPAAVKREAWLRAGGRCEWRLDSGAVCGSAVRLELDHVVPRALGGPSTIDNVRVLCRGHNDLSARRVFGDEWVDRCIARRRTQRRVSASRDGTSAAPLLRFEQHDPG